MLRISRSFSSHSTFNILHSNFITSVSMEETVEKIIPSYLKMDHAELMDRADQLKALTSPCSLCPRNCGSERIAGETGYCRTGYLPLISSIQPHHGEEKPLSGNTIFNETSCPISNAVEVSKNAPSILTFFINPIYSAPRVS